MELYTSVCYELSERLTKRYSTSFSLSSRLFDGSIRRHIYAIYGLVRIADEIVDTYRGSDILERLNNLEVEVARAIEAQYSANSIVHAYAQTARRFAIDSSLLTAALYTLAIVALITLGIYAWPVAAAGILYLINTLQFAKITDKTSQAAQKGWKRFLWLNYLTGAIVTMSCLASVI